MPSFDENLTRVLREAAELAPELPLVEAAERRGRRLRARRRAAVAGGTALLLAAGLTAAALRPAGGPTAIAPVASPSLNVDQQLPADQQFMLKTLRSLLPKGNTDTRQSGDTAWNGQGPSVATAYTAGGTSTTLHLDTNRMPLPLTRWTVNTQCADPFTTQVNSCTRTANPDGSVLVVSHELYKSSPLTQTVAAYTGADGRQLVLSALPQGGLTDEQLATVVSSPDWVPLFAHLPYFAAPGDSLTLTPDQMLARTTKLLPTGADTSSDTSKQNTLSQVHFTVTLGGRSSSLSISVVRGYGKGDPAAAQRAFDDNVRVFGGLTHAPDGSSVDINTGYTGQVAMTKGVQVDTLTPGGTRVTVSEWNGSDAFRGVGGPMALSNDQLTQLALGTDWSKD